MVPHVVCLVEAQLAVRTFVLLLVIGQVLAGDMADQLERGRGGLGGRELLAAMIAGAALLVWR